MSDPPTASNRLRTFGIVMLVLGVVLLVVGIVYFTVPADNLPAILGHVANSTKHHARRGTAGVAAGIVFLVIAGLAFARSRPRGR